MEDENLITCDKIIDALKSLVERKIPVSPSRYLNLIEKLAVLVGDEQDKLFDLQQKVAECKVVLMECGQSAVEARTRTEASEVYKEMLKMRAKIERITEIVRIGKLRAKLKIEEYNL